MTLIFYESPKRVAATLGAMAAVLGRDRPAAVCRELTKKVEETRRGTLGELAEAAANGQARGEYVIVVGAGHAEAATEDTVRAALQDALQTMRVKDAANAVAGAMNLPKREVYQMALKIAAEDD